MGIAGLWDCWQPDKGEPVFSFTMLTVNADEHPLMQQVHKPADEKRMVVSLPEEHYSYPEPTQWYV
jgi:putative SOS response-associated peptidase YedK